MDYVIAVQAPAFPLSPTRFATESAFAQHLRELRESIGPAFEKVVLIAPTLTDAEYAARRDHLGVVDLDVDGVLFMPGHSTAVPARQFWLRHARGLWRRIRAAVRQAGVVHSGVADDVWRPLMAMVNVAAWLERRPVMFLVDIDFRQHSRRYRQVGLWNLKQYLVNRLIYDPLVYVQVWFAPRMFQLVLLKSASMVRDFGRGRSHVRNFYDTAHGAQDVLGDAELDDRVRVLGDRSQPLQLVFFGRFVAYKGLDRTIEAVRLARARGADVRLTLIGAGDCEAALRRQTAESGIEDAVRFLPPVPYGAPLFEQLKSMHLCVATPLVEDTPRAAFDAMARGLPLVAFDISYFCDLAQASGAVALARWPEPAQLAEVLCALSEDRRRIADMARSGVAFARDNTQAVWLERRAEWMNEVVQPLASDVALEGR